MAITVVSFTREDEDWAQKFWRPFRDQARLRYHAFKDRGWRGTDIIHPGDLESDPEFCADWDAYDTTRDTRYFVAYDFDFDPENPALGCFRETLTTHKGHRSFMVADIYCDMEKGMGPRFKGGLKLLFKAPPRDVRVREHSRIAISARPDLPSELRKQVLFEMLFAGIEHDRLEGTRETIFMVPPKIEKRLEECGYNADIKYGPWVTEGEGEAQEVFRALGTRVVDTHRRMQAIARRLYGRDHSLLSYEFKPGSKTDIVQPIWRTQEIVLPRQRTPLGREFAWAMAMDSSAGGHSEESRPSLSLPAPEYTN